MWDLGQLSPKFVLCPFPKIYNKHHFSCYHFTICIESPPQKMFFPTKNFLVPTSSPKNCGWLRAVCEMWISEDDH